jgi:protein SCO1
MAGADRASTVAVVTVAMVAAIAGCGGGDGGSASTGKPKRAVAPAAKFSGAVANPPKPAAPLVLRDYRGRLVDLNRFRGRAVLVTFIYTHCPDVCPLIVGNLKVARTKLGQDGRKLQILAVSTDPRGDTPKAVRKFLHEHAMTGRMDYLIGSRPQLARVWRRWGIIAKADRANPERVEHSALIYGISASGKLTTLYPANFKPEQIVHDVPKLAAL